MELEYAIYRDIDEKLDYENVLPIINNAKLQAPSVCNALDTILIHEKQFE